MSNDLVPIERPASGHFHSLVYKILIGLGLWFVLATWGFIGDGHGGLYLAVASAIVLVATGLPTILTLAGHRTLDGGVESRFGKWARSDVDLWTGRTKGNIAAIEAILPIAAVAIGMTIFALVLSFSSP